MSDFAKRWRIEHHEPYSSLDIDDPETMDAILDAFALAVLAEVELRALGYMHDGECRVESIRMALNSMHATLGHEHKVAL